MHANRRPAVLRAALALPAVLALVAVPGCEPAGYDLGSWKPPAAGLAPNPNYPQCDASPQCRWGERCDPNALACTTDGDGLVLAPDFSATDANEHSATRGKTLSLSGQAGLVTVVYFGLSTCPHCWSHVVDLQDLLEQLADAGDGRVTALVVLYGPSAGAAWEMGQYTRLPLLPDDPDRTVWTAWGATIDTVAVVDATGFVRRKWDVYDFDAGVEPLRQAIRDAE